MTDIPRNDGPRTEAVAVALPEYDVIRATLRALPAQKRWTADQRDRWLAAMTAAVDFVYEIDTMQTWLDEGVPASLDPNPMTEPRTEAGRRLYDLLETEPSIIDIDGVRLCILAIEAEATAGQSSETPSPRDEGLDVERLARALHQMPHHYRGGADDDLARFACTQFGWEQSNCVRRATGLATRYAAVAALAGTDE